MAVKRNNGAKVFQSWSNNWELLGEYKARDAARMSLRKVSRLYNSKKQKSSAERSKTKTKPIATTARAQELKMESKVTGSSIRMNELSREQPPNSQIISRSNGNVPHDRRSRKPTEKTQDKCQSSNSVPTRPIVVHIISPSKLASVKGPCLGGTVHTNVSIAPSWRALPSSQKKTTNWATKAKSPKGIELNSEEISKLVSQVKSSFKEVAECNTRQAKPPLKKALQSCKAGEHEDLWFSDLTRPKRSRLSVDLLTRACLANTKTDVAPTNELMKDKKKERNWYPRIAQMVPRSEWGEKITSQTRSPNVPRTPRESQETPQKKSPKISYINLVSSDDESPRALAYSRPTKRAKLVLNTIKCQTPGVSQATSKRNSNPIPKSSKVSDTEKKNKQCLPKISDSKFWKNEKVTIELRPKMEKKEQESVSMEKSFSEAISVTRGKSSGKELPQRKENLHSEGSREDDASSGKAHSYTGSDSPVITPVSTTQLINWREYPSGSPRMRSIIKNHKLMVDL